MEVKVWVEGLPKIITGVSKETTCHDIVKALAYATKKHGRFVLVERWGQVEKPLAPADHMLHLLQQKGEYLHAVQFILHRMDTGQPAASPVESLSPLPRPQSEAPFQRAGKAGILRKSLTSYGTELSVPKVMRTRGNVLTEHNSQTPAPLQENNFPSDLVGFPSNLEPAKKLPAKENEPVQKSPLVPVIPYGSDVPLQMEETARGPRHLHGRQQSLDDQLYRKGYNLSNGIPVAEVKTTGKSADVKLVERRKQLSTEISQQKEQLAHTQADEMHLDRELALWEEKMERISRDVESFDASLNSHRSSEKSVIHNLKELSLLHLEDALRSHRKTEEQLRAEIALVRSNITSCQDSITRSETKARTISEQIRNERDSQDAYLEMAEVSLREERDRLTRELQHLVVMQDNQNRRLEDFALNEQRLDSTLLAKQLELDSLQGSLKKSNFDGFLGGITAQPETSPDPLPDPETERSRAETPRENSRRVETQPSPAAPARRAVSSQRILVLKRNSTRDPQGMWV